MPAVASPEDIAKQFGLESIPESVKRLNQLLTKCDATDTDDFAILVNQDPELTKRLLRAANPRADCEEDYGITTVEDALQRMGMSAVLLLAMSDPLIRALQKSFNLMLNIELKNVLPKTLDPFQFEHFIGEVGFSGKATGLVRLRLPKEFIPILGDRLLGLSVADMADEATANDVIGELCNMTVGNFKSNLCDAGLNCKLSPPKIFHTAEFQLHTVDGGSSLRYGFHAKEVRFYADLSVNPFCES
jgi:CheY-specific phosphatase CheX